MHMQLKFDLPPPDTNEPQQASSHFTHCEPLITFSHKCEDRERPGERPDHRGAKRQAVIKERE